MDAGLRTFSLSFLAQPLPALLPTPRTRKQEKKKRENERPNNLRRMLRHKNNR